MVTVLAIAACHGNGDQHPPGWLAAPVHDTAAVHDAAPVPVDSGSDRGANGSAAATVGSHELAFVIDHVYPRQKPTSTSPFHANGGAWTYFDAHVDGDPAATFATGVLRSKSAASMTYDDKAMLVPTTADAGARVVAAYARAFGVPVPPGASGPLRPKPFAITSAMHGVADRGADAVASAANSTTARAAGVGANDLTHGDFAVAFRYQGPGPWEVTIWNLTPPEALEQASMFFIYSLADHRGVVLEEASGRPEAVARILAATLQPKP